MKISTRLLLLFCALVFSKGDICEFPKYTVSDTEAKCMDGTPASYYVRQSVAGKHKWHIHFEGGGWCFSLYECKYRAGNSLGSSSQYPECGNEFKYSTAYFSRDASENPGLHDFNVVIVKYCDGGSFLGMADRVYEDRTLYFRGSKILRSVLDELIHLHGLGSAEEVVVSGVSAGGLIDSSFFMDFYGYSYGNPRFNGEFPSLLRGVYDLMGVSEARSLLESCTNAHIDDPSTCMLPVQALPYVTSPLFIIQSIYDSWQLHRILGAPIYFSNLTSSDFWTNEVNLFGANMTAELHRAVSSIPFFLYIDSCYHHTVTNSDSGLFTNITSSYGYTPSTALELFLSSVKSYYSGGTDFESREFTQGTLFPCESCCEKRIIGTYATKSCNIFAVEIKKS